MFRLLVWVAVLLVAARGSASATPLDRNITGRWYLSGGNEVMDIDVVRPQLYRVQCRTKATCGAMHNRSGYITATTTSLTLSIPGAYTLLGRQRSNFTLSWQDSSVWRRFTENYHCFTVTGPLDNKRRGSANSTLRKEKPPLASSAPPLNSTCPGGIPAANITKVHVVFTTHLDLGYTDYVWCVVARYFWYIYPGTVDTAMALSDYRYTTHPWLLYLYFNCDRLLPFIRPLAGIGFECPLPEMVQQVEGVIHKGHLVWHAFPFDGFNEMLGSELFDYAFDYAGWLAKKFDRPAVQVMAQIDVPGVYRAQLPTLLKNNVSALYIGQNFASNWAGPIPTLPNLFRWQAPSTNQSVILMTHALGYGGLTPSSAIVNPVTREALVVQCVLENRPPYTPQDVQIVKEKLANYYRNAKVEISTYDSFVGGLLPHAAASLPLKTGNIGDSWVRAVSSDPVKSSRFMSLRRGFESCVESGGCGRRQQPTMDTVLFLITGCEHNFGMPTQNNFGPITGSYIEKRLMLDSATAIASNTSTTKPVAAAYRLERSVLDKSRFSNRSAVPGTPTPHRRKLTCGDVTVGFAVSGAVDYLTFGTGPSVANSTNLLGLSQYTSSRMGRPRLNNIVINSTPQMDYVVERGGGGGSCSFYSVSALQQHKEKDNQGRHIDVVLHVQVRNGSTDVNFTVSYIHKGMGWDEVEHLGGSGLGDAMSIQFFPVTAGPVDWNVTVLNDTYSPLNFFPLGVSQYHIADSLSSYGSTRPYTVRSLDAPLAAFGNGSTMEFESWGYPTFNSGVWFNLWNQWNPNWVAVWPWNEDDSSQAFRFTLRGDA